MQSNDNPNLADSEKQKIFKEIVDGLDEEEIFKDWFELSHIPMNDKKREVLQQAVNESFEKNIPIKDALHIDPNAILYLEYQANLRYQNGQYDQSFLLFQVLSSIDPTNSRYFFGLGANAQMKQSFYNAVYYYMIAASFNKKDPLALFHAAYCYEKMQNIEMATALAQEGLKRCQEKQWDDLKGQFELMLATLPHHTSTTS